MLDSTFRSKAAIIFDWDNWWAVELSSGPTADLKYMEQIEKYYKAFYDMNISVDFVKPEGDFSKYDIVVAPVLYMVKSGAAENIQKFVEKGGTFVTTFFSGIVNENDLVTLGGYPGELRKLLGIWAEEIDALFPDMKNSMIMNNTEGFKKKEYSCGMLCDILHLQGAEALAVYGKDFYAGKPVLTVNKYGMGKAYYIASDPEEAFVKDFIKYITEEKNIYSDFPEINGVEITQRFKENKEFTFILNYNDKDVVLRLHKNI